MLEEKLIAGTLRQGLNSPSISRLISDEDVDALLAVFEQIAHEQGWQPGDQIRTPIRNAVCFAATVNGDLAGGLQLVTPDRGGWLPCHRVWPELDLGRRTDIAHITILALKAQYRGRNGLFWPLCVEMWRYCAAHNITRLSLEVTPDVLRLYQRLGWPLEIVGELRPHWGEDCFLCRMEIATVAGNMVLRATRSAVYRSVVAMMSQHLEEGRSVATGTGI